MTTFKRLPKYQRIPEKMNPIQNFKFYLPLLALLGEYHFLETQHIIALLGTSRTNTYNKLQKLFHHGYVERYTVPPTDFTLKSKNIVYCLSKKGKNFLLEADPQKYCQIYCPNRYRTLLFLRHELMISHFRVCLELALRKQKHAKLIFWKQGNPLKQILQKQQIKNFQIIPDGYFIIQNGEQELHYFFEADRGTMALKRFFKKIERYLKFFQQNRADTPKFFRVLTIAPSPKRTTNLRMITITGDSKKEKGSHRFWYGSETDYSLQNPENMLKPILAVGHIESKKKMSLLN